MLSYSAEFQPKQQQQQSAGDHLIAPGALNAGELLTAGCQRSLLPSPFSTHGLQLLGGKVCSLLLLDLFTQSHFH